MDLFAALFKRERIVFAIYSNRDARLNIQFRSVKVPGVLFYRIEIFPIEAFFEPESMCRNVGYFLNFPFFLPSWGSAFVRS
jgi:hypothetical protein